VIIYSQAAGEPRFCVVESCEYDDKNGFFEIAGKYVDWNGDRFGYATEHLAICIYSGTEAITSLAFFPVVFLTSRDEVEREAINRGQNFRD
jgi:hypothetical protein